MANVVFNKFTKEVMKDNINLSLPDTYKIAILKSYPKNIAPAAEDEYSFTDLLGHECVDSEEYRDEDEGYHSGGKYTLLNKIDTNRSDDILEYTCTGVTWNNVTLEDDNEVKYAIIYRESDGLLLSCYTFDNPISVYNDTLRLSWFDIPVISFWIHPTYDTPLGYDDSFDSTSNNALMNRVVTGGFKRYGVVINGEESPAPPLEDMDTLTSITPEYINSLFED